MEICALSGFLGRTDDWEAARAIKGATIEGIDPYQVRSPTSNGTIWSWAHAFNDTIASQGEKILMGYSMGGRLALHALLMAPERWRAAILVSCHPGLNSSQKRIARGDSDRMWATRFRNMQWGVLMKLWENQPAFSNTCSMGRCESDYCREELADTLVTWSLANQSNLRNRIAQVNVPILWLVGENDFYFAYLAEGLAFAHPSSRVVTLPGCGHRLPWDQSVLFCDAVTQWLLEIIPTSQDHSGGGHGSLPPCKR